MKQIKWILLALLVVVLVVVVFRNLEETSVELVFVTVELPLAALLTITLAIGMVLGLMLPTVWKVRHWRQGRSKKHEEPSGDSSKANSK